MSISIRCPDCGKSYRLRDDLAGRRVKCKCGHGMIVPKGEAPAEADESTYDVAAEPESDPRTSLLAEELLSRAEEAALAAPPESPADVPSPTAEKPARTRLAVALIAAGSTVGVLVVGALIFLVIGWIVRPGYASPGEALAAYQEAMGKKKWDTQLRTLDPDSQRKMVAMMAALAIPLSESAPEVREVLKKHGVQTATSSIEDMPAFYADLTIALEAAEQRQLPNNPLLKIMATKPRGDLRRALSRAELSNLEIDGDSARGTLSFTFGGETKDAPILFKRIEGRWFIHVPEPEDFELSPQGEAFGVNL